jgi:hypothetical protein
MRVARPFVYARKVAQRILCNPYLLISNINQTERSLREFALARSISSDHFKTKIAQNYPDLAAFFDTVQSTNALDLELSPIGIMLAKYEVEKHWPEDAARIDQSFFEG